MNYKTLYRYEMDVFLVTNTEIEPRTRTRTYDVSDEAASFVPRSQLERCVMPRDVLLRPQEIPH